jgi:hypothetical protein
MTHSSNVRHAAATVALTAYMRAFAISIGGSGTQNQA